MTDKYILINNIKLIRKVIDYGFEKALTYADGETEETYVKSFDGKNKNELLDEKNRLLELLSQTSNRKQSPYQKFCIGKCQREFIPKDGNVEIYCASCDRTIAVRPIKNNFKDI